MLSRRHLRIKTLQALYAFFLSENDNIVLGEKLLMTSIEKLHELYINQLSFLVEIQEFAKLRQEEAKLKFFPTSDELNPNTRFTDNLFLTDLSTSVSFRKNVEKYKINWFLEQELVKRHFFMIKENPDYQQYMESGGEDRQMDAAFVAKIVKQIIEGNESLEDFFEDKNIFWGADYDLSVFLLYKTIKYYQENNFDIQRLPSLFKDGEEGEREDLDFMKLLFRKCIVHSDEYEVLIKACLENWELERIATMDNLLLKMALCEFSEFSSIPVKVTMNEYIDISKSFSTPKSNQFINGILDKLLVQLQAEKKVIKRGRGLME
ncbi:MAG: transcription antitermination factor NusB [Bacteroidetes bacterium]|nr:transcription antitermination factor NusB [Bacteroidota bacterium]